MSLLTIAVCGAACGGGLALVALTMVRPKTVVRANAPTRREPSAGRAPRPFSSRRALLAVISGFVLAAATSWVALLPIGAAAAFFLPPMLKSDGGSAALIARIDAIATFTELLRDTLVAASGIGQAITAAAASAPEEIAPEARRLAASIGDRRVPMVQALRAFGEELADPTGDLVVLSLMFAARHSARDLASLLSSLAGAAREEAAMRTRIEVARARSRTAVRMIIAVTLGLGAVLYALDGSFLAPYGSAMGQLVLLAIGGLFATGFAWLAKLTRPHQAPRLLRAAPPGDANVSIPAPRATPATSPALGG
ncbi:type II secretion system F family protein [Actinospica robiniae]|uniref:type II secretion system F family protein n=1 Tax=Actinospica robiniae TaxID=304901 RepID=UPI0007C4F979|nr:hypothetical protein [Actinospica robiniae]